MTLICSDECPLQYRRSGGRFTKLDFIDDIGIADHDTASRADFVALIVYHIRGGATRSGAARVRFRRWSSMNGRRVANALETCSYRRRRHRLLAGKHPHLCPQDSQEQREAQNQSACIKERMQPRQKTLEGLAVGDGKHAVMRSDSACPRAMTVLECARLVMRRSASGIRGRVCGAVERRLGEWGVGSCFVLYGTPQVVVVENHNPGGLVSVIT